MVGSGSCPPSQPSSPNPSTPAIVRIECRRFWLIVYKKGVRRDLEDRFDGWSLAADKPLTGAWRNPESGQVEYDDSWRYEIGIDPSRLADLDAYLAQLAHRLGQKALWRVAYAGGEGKVIPARAPATR
jgi:hypothetical protein